MCYSLLIFLSGELRNHCGFIIVSVSSTWELTRKQTDSHMNHTDWFDSLNQPELDIAQIFHWITTSISVCLSNQTWNIVHMLYDYFYNYFNIFASLHLKKKKKNVYQNSLKMFMALQATVNLLPSWTNASMTKSLNHCFTSLCPLCEFFWWWMSN